MKKLIVILLACLACIGCKHTLTPEVAEQCIQEGERERLPLRLQRWENVKEICIDSIVFFCKTEPMSGYMYTTWKIQKSKLDHNWNRHKYIETKSIIVEIDNIQLSNEKKDYVEWNSDWGQAYIDAMR